MFQGFISKFTKNNLVKTVAAACIAASAAFGAPAQMGTSTTYWELVGGVLTISGTGATPDGWYNAFNYPWYFQQNSITKVVIEEGVTNIGEKAFEGYSGLEGELVIPNSVKTIGERAFYYCTGLTSVTIGNSVTSIGDRAFQNCAGLTGELVIPNSVTSIGTNAFQYCTGFTGELVIPNSITETGMFAFYGCTGFTALTIPNSVTSIGNAAFNGCTGLTQINNLATTPQSIDTWTFWDVTTSSVKLYVPAQSLDAYKSADIWKDFNVATPFTFNNTTIAVGETLNAEFDEEYANKTLTWSSGNPAVVIENGKITAGAGNTATITATTTDGYFSVGHSVNVVKGKITVPSVANTALVYDGNVKSAGIATNAHYDITGGTATNAGQHTATVALKDKTNYEWADGKTDNLTLTWSIAKAAGVFGTPAAASATYSPALKLSDLNLPAGYVFNTPATALNAGNNQRFAATFTNPNGNYNAATGNIVVNVAKATGAAVVPTLASKTHNSITINAIVAASGQVVNYAINTANTAPTDATAWKTDLTFANLTPNTDYYIFARAIENANYLAGAVSASLSVKTSNSVPIREIQKSDGRTGIRLSKNVVSDKAEFEVILPNDKVLEVKAVIYDNTSNVVFEKIERGAKLSWNLTNISGRNVANGAYLIIVEAKGVNGNYAYSAKVGVKK